MSKERTCCILLGMKSKFLLAMSGIESEIKAVRAALEAQLSTKDSFSEICDHLTQDFGKCVRSTMMVLWFRSIDAEKDIDQLLHLAVGIELIHMASLVHDDIIDESDTRRNIESVRSLAGDHVAMLTGVYVYALALDSVAKIQEPIYVSMISTMVKNLCSGEHDQLANRYKVFDHLDAYLHMIKQKTSVLFSTALTATARLAGADDAGIRAADQFGDAFGVIYQVTDDILDVYGEDADLGKRIGQDLRVGDTNLPLQLLLDYVDEGDRASLLKGFGEDDLAFIQAGLEKYKPEIVAKADAMIQTQYHLAKEALMSFSDSKYQRNLLKIMDLVMQRYQHQVRMDKVIAR